MAHYLVRAKPQDLDELATRLEQGEIHAMSPFGAELHQCMLKARVTPDGWATWEENCYCSPPLKQERAVLDLYFTELTTQNIEKGEGWQQIEHLPKLLS